VWTVRIQQGACSVTPGFAQVADVRYTADARVWCAVALGQLDAREAVAKGLLNKDGGPQAMDYYFHQIREPGGEAVRDGSSGRGSAKQQRRAS
jgi:hypothetical protein